MSNSIEIYNFLMEEGSHLGLLLFMNSYFRMQWINNNSKHLLLNGCGYGSHSDMWIGPKGNRVLLMTHVDKETMQRKINSLVLKRFWHEGLMPKAVGLMILEKCR